MNNRFLDLGNTLGQPGTNRRPDSCRWRGPGCGRHCEWQKGCGPAAWSQCRLTGILITKSSGSRRPKPGVLFANLSALKPTVDVECFGSSSDTEIRVKMPTRWPGRQSASGFPGSTPRSPPGFFRPHGHDVVSQAHRPFNPPRRLAGGTQKQSKREAVRVVQRHAVAVMKVGLPKPRLQCT